MKLPLFHAPYVKFNMKVLIVTWGLVILSCQHFQIRTEEEKITKKKQEKFVKNVLEGIDHLQTIIILSTLIQLNVIGARKPMNLLFVSLERAQWPGDSLTSALSHMTNTSNVLIQIATSELKLHLHHYFQHFSFVQDVGPDTMRLHQKKIWT